MSELRKEIQGYIDTMPDEKLEALRPLLTLLAVDMTMDQIIAEDMEALKELAK